MIEIKGKYNTAKVYADIIEETAISQIIELCNQKFVSGSKIRIMPDVHAGAGCTIGTTMTIGDKIVPNLVGVDIGCGMHVVELGNVKIDYDVLDRTIRECVPLGFNVHEERKTKFEDIQYLECFRELKDTKKMERAIGTLGGGNHFIEIDADAEGNKYLVIHSGSRNLGKQVADYYQGIAYELLQGKDQLLVEQAHIIEQYKREGRKQEIAKAIKDLYASWEKKGVNIPKDLCYLSGKSKDEYLNDMGICQKYADLNRKTIGWEICLHMGWHINTSWSCVHNYIDMGKNILRKGAVSAQSGEQILIPLNMRDGSIIAIGKGNEDWNCSAPHGAGRTMRRSVAKESITLEDFQESMEGIYSTSINMATLDESPFAYKNQDDIITNLTETATITKIIKPLYNIKA
jgi:RNA-splicing ligase RtcB